jgi:hypothetical protein
MATWFEHCATARCFDDARLLGDECKCRPAKGGAGDGQQQPVVVQNELTALLSLDKTSMWLVVGLIAAVFFHKGR